LVESACSLKARINPHNNNTYDYKKIDKQQRKKVFSFVLFTLCVLSSCDFHIEKLKLIAASDQTTGSFSVILICLLKICSFDHNWFYLLRANKRKVKCFATLHVFQMPPTLCQIHAQCSTQSTFCVLLKMGTKLTFLGGGS